jgi:hypothetical protein
VTRNVTCVHTSVTSDLELEERICVSPSSESYSKARKGRAIAQAVNHRLPTAVARVRFQFRSCGICCGRSGIGAGFARVLRFPLPVLIPPTHRLSSGAGTVGPLVAGHTKWTASPHSVPIFCSFTLQNHTWHSC